MQSARVNALSKYSVAIAFFVWWSFWITLQFKILSGFGFSFMECFTDSLLSQLLLAAVCLLIINNMRYYLPGKEKYWYVLVISFALTVIWIFATRIILWSVFRSDKAFTGSLIRTSNIRFAFGFLMTACITMLSLIWNTQKEETTIAAMKLEAETIARDAELFKLRQQLQPHFLFNSLNSIGALAGSDPEKARHMIQQLSDFLRGTLKKEEKQLIPLEEEIHHLELYLDIEKVRFGHRLQTSIQFTEEIAASMIPALILQPVVENAIKFGLYDTTGEVLISINSKLTDKGVEITVTNPFDSGTSDAAAGTGFGLASIKRRLFLLFARQDLLNCTTEENTFITTLIIPPAK